MPCPLPVPPLPSQPSDITLTVTVTAAGTEGLDRSTVVDASLIVAGAGTLPAAMWPLSVFVDWDAYAVVSGGGLPAFSDAPTIVSNATRLAELQAAGLRYTYNVSGDKAIGIKVVGNDSTVVPMAIRFFTVRARLCMAAESASLAPISYRHMHTGDTR